MRCFKAGTHLGFCARVCYLAFVMSGGDVHLLLHHVVDVGGRAALDPLLLLPLQLVSHHLDGLRPLISEFETKTNNRSVHTHRNTITSV